MRDSDRDAIEALRDGRGSSAPLLFELVIEAADFDLLERWE